MADYRDATVHVPDGTDTTTLEGAKAFRIAEQKAWARALVEITYPDLDLIFGALDVVYTGTQIEQARANITGVKNRTAANIALINACTTAEEVFALALDFEDITPQVTARTNCQHTSGAPNTVLGGTEVKIGQVTITPSHANAKIRIEATAQLTKDTGTAIREATIAVRRGDSNTAQMVGQRCIVRSQNVASTAYGPAVIIEIDSPGTTDPITYTLRGVMTGAVASTVSRASLIATEI